MTDTRILAGLKDVPRSRRMRLFGLNNSILSNRTVYLNPCLENQTSLTSEEAALLAALSQYFNEGE